MLYYFDGDVYVKSDIDIIFNPVGVRDNKRCFIKRVKNLYPKAYTSFKEKVYMYSRKELLGDIQMISIGHSRVMMNAFCKEKDGSINNLALCKTLVELCNLAYEYHTVVGIEYGLGEKEETERNLILTVVEEIFKDVDVPVYIYDRHKY